MIKIKLSDLLGKHKMTQKALAEVTHIRPATVSKMYYEEIKRIVARENELRLSIDEIIKDIEGDSNE